MPRPPDLAPFLAPGRALRPVRGAIASALPAGEAGAPYDRHAAIYDRLIGNPLYNAVAWGARPSDYAGFAAEALATGEGPFLDAGCGTLVFTAAPYRTTDRPLVLVDRSAAMLERGAARLAGAPAALVQADLHDLPFRAGAFGTVACFGVLHVLDDPWAALAALCAPLAPGGRLFASMLVSDRPVSRAWLVALRRRGEVGPACSAADLERAAKTRFGSSVEVRRTGSMAWLRATAS